MCHAVIFQMPGLKSWPIVTLMIKINLMKKKKKTIAQLYQTLNMKLMDIHP